MKQARIFVLVGGLLMFIFSSLVYAGVPQMINYQGKLTTPAGALIDDTLSIVFTIYDAATDGGVLWTETQATVIVEKGIFSVLLGSVNPIPDTVFTGAVRYLGVKVEADPEMTPRKEIVSVGYAYKAEYADTAAYAQVAVSDGDWNFRITDTADTTLMSGGEWGIARAGNVLYGNEDSTHVNLGVACTTGTSGQNYHYCIVSGGLINKATHSYATVGGGYRNTASWQSATVGGGDGSRASGYFSTVAGGHYNEANGWGAFVGGGEANWATQKNSTVAGGEANKATGWWSTVAGGQDDTASGKHATVGGGRGNTASAVGATVAGGTMNAASGTDATVGGGASDTASGANATVGGGWRNTASGERATVGGGLYNAAIADDATVGGGYDNAASGWRSTIGGGWHNRASGDYSTVLGGSYNTAAGYHSLAGGENVNILSTGLHSFAFGYNFTIAGPYQVVFHDPSLQMRVGINLTNPTYAITLPNNANNSGRGMANAWNTYSSIRWKENISSIDDALEKVLALRGVYFDWKQDKTRGIGLIAEEVGKVIPEAVTYEENGVDAEGLDYARLTAVLVEALKEQQKEIESLKARIDALEVNR